MKCPKCGYNSFEYYDICQKCSGSLSGFKQAQGISALVLPEGVRASLAEKLSQRLFKDQARPAADDMFRVSPPDAGTGAAAAPVDDPFDFGDLTFGEPAGGSAALLSDDAFDRLELGGSAAGGAASASTPISSASFDLDNFSWDDDLKPGTGGAGKAPLDDDFDDLFGLKDDPKK